MKNIGQFIPDDLGALNHKKKNLITTPCTSTHEPFLSSNIWVKLINSDLMNLMQCTTKRCSLDLYLSRRLMYNYIRSTSGSWAAGCLGIILDTETFKNHTSGKKMLFEIPLKDNFLQKKRIFSSQYNSKDIAYFYCSIPQKVVSFKK